MRKTGIATVAVLGLACAGAALAQMPEVETYQLGAVEVRVIAQPFLTEEELMTLRLVGQNPDALALFVPEGTGFAALVWRQVFAAIGVFTLKRAGCGLAGVVDCVIHRCSPIAPQSC